MNTRPTSAVTTKHGEISDQTILNELLALETSPCVNKTSTSPSSSVLCLNRANCEISASEGLSPRASKFEDESYATPPTVYKGTRRLEDEESQDDDTLDGMKDDEELRRIG